MTFKILCTIKRDLFNFDDTLLSFGPHLASELLVPFLFVYSTTSLCNIYFYYFCGSLRAMMTLIPLLGLTWLLS